MIGLRAAQAEQRAWAGGLQQHSIGPLYPWAVVGRGTESAWEVHNLQDSTVIFHGAQPWQGSCRDALGLAHMAKHGLEYLAMSGYRLQPEPPTAHEQALKAGTRDDVLGTEVSPRPYAGRATGWHGTVTGRLNSSQPNFEELPRSMHERGLGRGSYPERAQEATKHLGETPFDIQAD
jgi:hypothetical protein